MTAEEHRIEADGVRLTLDLLNGHIADFEVRRDGRALKPLHRAPWIGEELSDDIPVGLSRLSGDFFCAPFGRNDIEEAPGHGWPANAPWDLVEDESIEGGHRARFRLTRTVFGATVDKVITLRDGQPFVYQEHIFSGGTGLISVAHHLMTRMEAGGTLAFSPKRFALTLDDPLEPDPARGRYALQYPAQTQDLSAFPLAGGGTTDLHAYPPSERHEDFLTLAEVEGSPLGWTTVSRHAEKDMVVVLKNAQRLPVTMLWMSNGGRDYAPWNSRHAGVLGVEDARASGLGHAGSIGENALNRQGVPTAFDLGFGDLVIRQAFGVLPLEETQSAVTGVEAKAGRLMVSRDGNGTLAAPFEDAFLA